MSDQEFEILKTEERKLWEKVKTAEDATRAANHAWIDVYRAISEEKKRREVEHLVQQRLSQAKEMGKALACGCRSLEEAR